MGKIEYMLGICDQSFSTYIRDLKMDIGTYMSTYLHTYMCTPYLSRRRHTCRYLVSTPSVVGIPI